VKAKIPASPAVWWFFDAKAKKIVSGIRFWTHDQVLDINFLQKFTRTDLFA
jgi:hypothetical protein